MTGRSALFRDHLTSAGRILSVGVAVLVLFFAAVPLAHAQVTTGSLAGAVTDPDGGALPGVTVEAVHVPTGTRYDTVTDGSGRYTIPNVRVGGPYRITATLEGFRQAEVTGVQVALGTTVNTPLQMRLAAVTEAITVTADVDPVISPNRTGSASSVSQEMIEALPTVNRTLQDFARTNPYFTTDLSSAGTTLNVAGRNNKYNNIQIDGAVNNDLFGLASSGTPGGQAGTQPISLDAIQQLQLVVSPYDVRQSGFTGGGINAVTRSGTNDLEGSLFYSQRDRSFVGKGINDTPVAKFDQTSWGGRIGGPILRDRLFYFVSGEQNRRESPLGISSSIYTGTGTGNLPGLADVSSYMKSKYNIELGDTGDIVSQTNNDLLFGRLDFNIGSKNNLTVRHNYVKASDPSAPSSYSRTPTMFYYPSSRYFFEDETNSSVAQLNSVFSANAYNEARLVYQTIADARTTPILFPTVEIGGSGPRRGAIQIGTERFSGANSLDQKIVEFTDDFTLIKGAHTLVFGTHNEIFEFKNLFISDFYGYYWFRTLDDFMTNKPPVNYSIGFATGDNPRRPTQFEAAQYSLYVNDQWRLPHNVTLSFGLRADKPSFPDTPSFNPLVQQELGLSTSSKPKDDVMWQPRFGFNWDPTGDGTQQVRGGVGIFLGRAPYVWISNGYGGTGIETVSLQCNSPSCTTLFNPDPLSQPRNFPAGTAAPSISITDPDFEFPQVLRATLGYDRQLPWGIRGTAELLYSETQSDIYYKNMNWVQSGTSPLDGRPTYSRVTTKVSDTYMVSNTDIGREISETIQLSKRFRNMQFDVNYMHQDAKSAADAGSSTASSGWNFQTNRGDIFNPEMATTYFQVKHRFNAAATYDLITGPLTHSFGLFYAVQSGNPYSLLIDGNPNRDSSSSNDLLYIPGGTGLILCPYNNGNTSAPAAGRPCGGATPLDPSLFTSFLASTGADPDDKGIMKRNVLQQPWQRRLDFHYELGLPAVMGTRVSLTADMLNLLNLFNNEWGVQKYVNFSTYTPVRYQGIDPDTGKPVYREYTSGSLNPGAQYTGTTSTASRWQASLRLRVNF